MTTFATPRQQMLILAARYRDTLLGDLPALLVLLAQAPIIGWCCTLVWGSIERDTPSLYFVMVLACLWFGCINACREIVRERNIVERERLLGLNMSSYVSSKFLLLALLGLLQALLLQMTIESELALQGPFLVQSFILWGAALCGVGLGLIVSAFASSQAWAVGMVPLLIIPQIVFSEFVIPRDYFSTLMTRTEKIMPTYWSFQSFNESAKLSPDWLWMAGSLAALFVYALLLWVGATLCMRRRQDF